MLLKWLSRIQDGRGSLENLGGQIADWANEHPDDLVYSRATLWLKHKTNDPIQLIGDFVRHLELFWDDDLSWYKLGELYVKEGLFDQAAFCFDEAIGLAPKFHYYYRAAAAARLRLPGNEVNREVARKQLCKAVLLNPGDQEAWQLLIDNTQDKGKRDKFIAYRNQVAKAQKND
jgi:tetratricopeptide (TPR) repeat protein